MRVVVVLALVAVASAAIVDGVLKDMKFNEARVLKVIPGVHMNAVEDALQPAHPDYANIKTLRITLADGETWPDEFFISARVTIDGTPTDYCYDEVTDKQLELAVGGVLDDGTSGGQWLTQGGYWGTPIHGESPCKGQRAWAPIFRSRFEGMDILRNVNEDCTDTHGYWPPQGSGSIRTCEGVTGTRSALLWVTLNCVYEGSISECSQVNLDATGLQLEVIIKPGTNGLPSVASAALGFGIGGSMAAAGGYYTTQKAKKNASKSKGDKDSSGSRRSRRSRKSGSTSKSASKMTGSVGSRGADRAAV